MQKTKFILLLIFIIISPLAISAQSIVGKWKISEYSTTQVLSGSEKEKQKILTDSLKKKVLLTFNEDGTFFRKGFSPYEEKGKWELKGNRLIISVAPFYIKDTLDIESLTSTNYTTKAVIKNKKVSEVEQIIQLKKGFGFGDFPAWKWKVVSNHESVSTHDKKEQHITIKKSKGKIKLDKDGTFKNSGVVDVPRDKGSWKYNEETKTLSLNGAKYAKNFSFVPTALNSSKKEISKDDAKDFQKKMTMSTKFERKHVEVITLKITYKKQ